MILTNRCPGRKRDVVAVLTSVGMLCGIGPYVSTIAASGHNRSQKMFESVLGSVHFVHVDVVDSGAGDGQVEAAE